MTQFLASVRNESEAEVALEAGANLVDLKEPSRGALGAVDDTIIVGVMRRVGARAAVSATVGDVPMMRDEVHEKVAKVAACGVDYVKLGLLPERDPRGCLESFGGSQLVRRLIVVLFADRLPDFDAVSAAANIGAAGVMLDTAEKSAGSLLDHLHFQALARFVAAAKARSLLVGLAGSLRKEQVPSLLALAPDLLGFRGALCRGGKRGGELDSAACREVRALIPLAVNRLHPRPTIPRARPLRRYARRRGAEGAASLME
jgi:dihydroneopterin aldolase